LKIDSNDPSVTTADETDTFQKGELQVRSAEAMSENVLENDNEEDEDEDAVD